jgi:hydrogenase/urease accessory protein HupE
MVPRWVRCEQQPLYYMATGAALGFVGIAVGFAAEALLVFLAPAGLLIAWGGLMLVCDYGGSVDWMARRFLQQQHMGWVPAQRLYVRMVGAGTVVVGLIFAAGGVAYFIKAL